MIFTLATVSGGREHVLNELSRDLAWLRTRLKSPEGAASALVEIAKRTALNEVSAFILPDIQDFYDKYIATNGERPLVNDLPTYGDWEEGLDDGCLALFEPYANLLSSSWLNFISSDCALWQEGEPEKLANSFAAEVWKQLTWGRTNNQILSGVGVVHDDLTAYGFMPTEPAPPPQPEYTPMAVNAILNRIMLTMPDPDQLADDLDFASDTDDALALGAAQRLGISMQDVAVLRQARAASNKAPEAWQNAIEAGEMLDEAKHYADMGEPSPTKAALKASLVQDNQPPDLPLSLRRTSLPPPPVAAGAVPPPPVSSVPPPPLVRPTALPPPPVSTSGEVPAPGKGRKGPKNNEPPLGYVPLEVLRSIKDHSGVKDEILADLMGISRPTLGSIMKGKSFYVPTDDRRQALLNMVAKHVEELHGAWNAISA